LPLFRARSGRLHLVGCSPSIIRVAPDGPEGTHVTGAWLDRTTPDELPADMRRFLDAGAAPIVVAFGSMAGAPDSEIASAIEAMLAGGRRVLIQGGVAPAVQSPNLFRIGRMDHRPLFARAALVIHHGGSGTSHAACAAGVPSLVVPHVGDQPYWADRLHRVGVAPAPQPARSLAAEELASAALAAASDPALRRRASELAERMSTEDGIAAAAAAIEGAHA
jgi:sterol 3beta-glucosyltransferase